MLFVLEIMTLLEFMFPIPFIVEGNLYFSQLILLNI